MPQWKERWPACCWPVVKGLKLVVFPLCSSEGIKLHFLCWMNSKPHWQSDTMQYVVWNITWQRWNCALGKRLFVTDTSELPQPKKELECSQTALCKECHTAVVMIARERLLSAWIWLPIFYRISSAQEHPVNWKNSESSKEQSLSWHEEPKRLNLRGNFLAQKDTGDRILHVDIWKQGMRKWIFYRGIKIISDLAHTFTRKYIFRALPGLL